MAPAGEDQHGTSCHAPCDLRASFDALLQRHQAELQGCLEHWFTRHGPTASHVLDIPGMVLSPQGKAARRNLEQHLADEGRSGMAAFGWARPRQAEADAGHERRKLEFQQTEEERGGTGMTAIGWDRPRQPETCAGRDRHKFGVPAAQERSEGPESSPASSARVEGPEKPPPPPRGSGRPPLLRSGSMDRASSVDSTRSSRGDGETIASSRGFQVRSLSDNGVEAKRIDLRRTSLQPHHAFGNKTASSKSLKPAHSRGSLCSDGSGAKSDASPISMLQIDAPTGYIPARFSGKYGEGAKTPQHKKWQHLTRGQNSLSRFKNLTPLAKKRMEQMVEDQSFLQRLTRNTYFEHAEAVAIVLNGFFVLCETERRAALVSEDPQSEGVVKGEAVFNVFGDLFCLLFAADLVLRIRADKWVFFRSRERLWNIFDIVVVATAALESIARWHQFGTASLTPFRIFAGKFSFLRVFRVLQIIRRTRTIRMSRFTRELNIMVYSLAGALKPLLWSVILLVAFLLVFAVFLTDGAVAAAVKALPAERSGFVELSPYFGSLPLAVLSLYEAMTGGVDWNDIWLPLGILDPMYRFSFLIFITFAVLSLMNVVTAVFVETAIQRSTSDGQMRVQKELDNKAEFVQNMQRVFEELDTNSSGTLTLEEFEKQMEDENVLTFLSTLELDIDQVKTLLCLLDRDQNGEVDVDEFITGCIRLKGGAKSLDMAILQYQVEWIVYNMAWLTASVQQHMEFFGQTPCSSCDN
mmetsp:Transcript_24947/g.48655  ORF Transcript_24947/g.48655 Transcript_24947/m.48655 type:complete len:751 (+) Transcript_24947:81-2333(+)